MKKSKKSQYERLCGEAYQVVGVLASEANRFHDVEVNKILDNLSFQQIVHEDVLPFSSKKNLPSDNEIQLAKDALESIKASCEVEYYQKLKTLLDYF